jgi:hypothetical protein
LSDPDIPSDSVTIVDKVTLSIDIEVNVRPVNCGLSEEESPNEALAVFPDSKTKFEPSPTIKPPSVGVKLATSVSCGS